MKTILKLSGQQWKMTLLYINSAIMLILFIILFFIDRKYPGAYENYLIVTGIFGFSIVLFAYIFTSISIRCPTCNDKWFWRAISKVKSLKC
jgi:hypothetical protein